MAAGRRIAVNAVGVPLGVSLPRGAARAALPGEFTLPTLRSRLGSLPKRFNIRQRAAEATCRFGDRFSVLQKCSRCDSREMRSSQRAFSDSLIARSAGPHEPARARVVRAGPEPTCGDTEASYGDVPERILIFASNRCERSDDWEARSDQTINPLPGDDRRQVGQCNY